jgi:nucleotide-binding universal stress UspA family protein
MIRKILVALDGSDHANRALEYALDIAEKYSAALLFLSVFHQVTIAGIEPTFSTVQLLHTSRIIQKEYHERILSTAVTKIMSIHPDLKVTTRLSEGHPADKIIELAEAEHCDLIVMGSRGLGGLKEMFLGSVSDKVADHASCPVLIVR